MLSERELDDFRDLVNNASPGPWEAHANGLHMDGSAQYRIGPRGRPGGVYFQGWHNDAAFIAASRVMVPELLAYIDLLREELDQRGLRMEAEQEAALLARQRDELLSRCAVIAEQGGSSISLDAVYEAFLHDPDDGFVAT